MGNKKLAAKRAAAAAKAKATLVVNTTINPVESPPPVVAALITPTQGDEESPTSAKEMKANLYAAITFIFQNKRLHREWLDAESIIDAINMLSQMPKCPAVVKGIYKSKDILPALQKGVGSKELVGDSACDFGCHSQKEFFFAKQKTRDAMYYFIYVDSRPSKIVPAPRVGNSNWLEDVRQTTSLLVTRFNTFPLELIELTNYWYSTNAMKLFEPTEDETPREAARNQMRILLEAANDDAKMRELIDGLGINDDLPVHKATGEPIKLDKMAVEREFVYFHGKSSCFGTGV